MNLKGFKRFIVILMTIILVIGSIPVSVAAEDHTSSGSSILFTDSFESRSFTQNHWKDVPAQWDVKTEGNLSSLQAVNSNTRTFLQNVDAASWTDYEMSFKAKFTSNVVGRAEFFVRADQNGNFYSVEAQIAQNQSQSVVFKMHRWSNMVYQGNITTNVTHTFDPTAWHVYKVEVKGSTIKLWIDDSLIITGTDPNHHYPAGNIGFRSQNIGLQMDELTVKGQGGTEEPAKEFQLVHTPITQISATGGAELTAHIPAPSAVTGQVYYRYGYAEDGAIYESANMNKGAGDNYTVRVPGPHSAERTTMNYMIEAADSGGSHLSSGYRDHFTNPSFTAAHFTQVPEQWIVTHDSGIPVMKANASNTRNYLTQANAEGWRDYDVEFKGKFTKKADGLAEFYFRADEAGNYYAIEAQTLAASNQVTLKLHYWESNVYKGNLTANVTTTLDTSIWNDYRIKARGGQFSLFVNGNELISATDANNRFPTGGIGFRSNNVGLEIAALSVSHPVQVTGFQQLSLTHTPKTTVPFNADIPVLFQVTDAGSPVTAVVYYQYGDGEISQVRLRQEASQSFTMNIPGTSRFDHVSYYIVVQDDENRTARYPASGQLTVQTGQFQPYVTDFENMSAGSVPPGWSVRGDAKVVQLPEGMKVLRLNGQKNQAYPSATLSDPQYANLDNFALKFRAKYVRTSDESYNVWRLRYRAQNDNNNYSMEWGSHNMRYFIMRKTDLGGNYALGTYNESLDNRWIDYEVRVSGITHELYINGAKVIGIDDFDQLRIGKGYIQFGTVNGINLMIDSIQVQPLESALVYYVEPAGNYTGIYGPGEQAGVKVHLSGGSASHDFQVRYTVHKADGDKGLVSQGSVDYPLVAYEERNETLILTPALNQIGTYDVKLELYIDGVHAERFSKNIRMAVVKQLAEQTEPDMQLESKFGANTHYALNWRDDLMEAARKAGIKHHRSGLNLADVFANQYDSSGKPIFDFTKKDAYLNKIQSFGLYSIPVFGFIEDTRKAASYEGLKLIESFANESTKHYKGQFNRYETPNEPENYVKPYVPYEIVQQWKRAYMGVKKADPSATFIAGDHTSSVRSILPKELELGAYNYADAFSWHPYVYNAMPDGAIESFIHDVGGMVNQYGGWKDFYLTEGGWPTAKGGHPSVTEEVQRDYIVRAFLIYMTQPQVRTWEYYNFKNDGTDENYYEIFWGMTDVDGRPKLSYGAVNNMMTTLEGAEYAGRLDVPDNKVKAYVYLKDSKPIIVAWRSVDHKDNPDQVSPVSELSLQVGSSEVTVRDINGNDTVKPTVNGITQVTVSGSPVYILNASPDVLYSGSLHVLEDYQDQALEQIKNLKNSENEALVTPLLTKLDSIQIRLAATLQNSNLSAKAQGLEQGIEDVYALMTELAVEIQNANIDRVKTFVAMETLYNYAEAASKPLIQARHAQGIQTVTHPYKSNVQQAVSKYELKTAGHHLLPVSTSALLRVQRYAAVAESRLGKSRYAESDVYGLLAGEFAKVLEQIIAADLPIYTGVWLNVNQARLTGEPGYTARLAGTAVNDTDASKQVTIRLELPAGWGELPPETVRIPANDTYNFDIPLLVPANASKGQYTPKLILESDGAIIETAKVELSINDAIKAIIKPVVKPFAELDEVEVELKGISEVPKTGRVVLRGPDGAPLTPLSGDTFANLAKDQTVSQRFAWNYKTTHDFNRYVNDLTVTDTVYNRVIFEDKVPLDFLITSRISDQPAIDGQLKDWKKAYPIHLRGADKNNTGVYNPTNLDAVAYTLWDEHNLFMAVEVTDDIHKASENPPNMWKNDSVQFGIDPLKDSSASYNQDDMEWGFALHNDGTHLSNIYYSRPPNLNGNVSSQLPYSISRDEALHKTYYEIQIPKTMIHHLTLGEGETFRFNVAVNDADMQAGRDNFIQWTRGVADSKNPGIFNEFKLIKSEGNSDPGPVTKQKFVLSADKAIVEVNDHVSLTVAAEQAEDLYGIDLRMEYSTGHLRLEKIEALEPFAEGGENGQGFILYQDHGGKLHIVASKAGFRQGVSGSAPLLRLTFKTLNQSDLSTVTLGAGAVLSDSTGIDSTVEDGASYQIAIADSTAITGQEPRSDAIVLLGKAFGKKMGDAGYELKLDMNKDGRIDIVDISYVALRILRRSNSSW
ncbi:family 16 glycoside hydrolase [Paenibacillus sp. FSL H7-0331]|uniref:family 16 glycoside hydrolase n=1 Tax=Paenibacillus sp. FSL H7-0331 TaxID=1920421 RepID=UPI00096DADA8|nr:family 16 glycoside hydrolase [Paenibacillus sp. FSL H7-0331]OMF06091.1 hypothetical protein BK127_31635 [Paenibacillus sp. FSL H7-0331]